MEWKYLFLTLSFCITYSYQGEIKISVYYESLCPDSKDFILDQLYPTYQEFSSYMNLDFVPYGAASHELVNGEWKFKCQHGENECIGNKVQAVALNLNYSDATNMDFVHCMMRAKEPHNSGELCANKFKEMSWQDITTLLNNGEGDEMLAAMGDRTYSVKPPITYIPTIYFDDKYNTDLQEEAIENIKEVMCNLLKREPEQCQYKKEQN